MEKKRVVAIIQAHMSSSRLPGKILKDLCGMPALYRMIERIRNCKHVDEVVIATSTMKCDDIIVEQCDMWGVSSFRGSDDDVLERYWGAAHAYPADVYMRVTSDNPLVDPGYLDECVEFFFDNGYRYVRCDEKAVNGMECEIFWADLLDEAYENSTESYEREHVTPYMYWKQDSIGIVPFKCDGSKYRLTLDMPEDYEVIKRVYEALYQPGNRFNMDEILGYLDEHPEILAINAQIQQKAVK